MALKPQGPLLISGAQVRVRRCAASSCVGSCALRCAAVVPAPCCVLHCARALLVVTLAAPLSSTQDGTMRIWDMSTRSIKERMREPPVDGPRCLYGLGVWRERKRVREKIGGKGGGASACKPVSRRTSRIVCGRVRSRRQRGGEGGLRHACPSQEATRSGSALLRPTAPASSPTAPITRVSACDPPGPFLCCPCSAGLPLSAPLPHTSQAPCLGARSRCREVIDGTACVQLVWSQLSFMTFRLPPLPSTTTCDVCALGSMGTISIH